MTDEIIISVDQHIANVTLNRPDARNALTFGMYQALADLVGKLAPRKMTNTSKPL